MSTAIGSERTAQLTDRPVVTVGALSGQALANLQVVVAELGLSLLVAPGDEIPDTGALSPLAIMVPLGGPSGSSPCVKVRLRRAYAHVPVIALTGESSDLAFSEIFSAGGDEVIASGEPDRLRSRLRALARAQHGEPLAAGRKGLAVVAGSDAAWRGIVGRVLLNGGFNVDFAIDSAAARRPEANLIVADEELLRDGGLELLAERDAAAPQPWVVAVAPKNIGAVRSALVGRPRVAVTDAYAPPENVIFLANELGFEVASRRQSPRALFGTSVAFRAAGRERDEVGFTYNISAGGLYVRTLAPLDADQEAWIELWPPRSDRRVRLVGRVAWRRAFGQSETATVPPGFGVKLDGGLGDDLARYRAGYDSLGHAAD